MPPSALWLVETLSYLVPDDVYATGHFASPVLQRGTACPQTFELPLLWQLSRIYSRLIYLSSHIIHIISSVRVHMPEYNPSLLGGLNWEGGSFARSQYPTVVYIWPSSPTTRFRNSFPALRHTVYPIPRTKARCKIKYGGRTSYLCSVCCTNFLATDGRRPLGGARSL